METLLYNWHHPLSSSLTDTVDLLVGADVIYLSNSLKPICKLLLSALKQKTGLAVIVDPGRCNAEEFTQLCLETGLVGKMVELDNVEARGVCVLKRANLIFMSRMATQEAFESYYTEILQPAVSMIPRAAPGTQNYGYCL